MPPAPSGGWLRSQGSCFYRNSSFFSFFFNHLIYWSPVQEFFEEREFHCSETKPKQSRKLKLSFYLFSTYYDFLDHQENVLLLPFPTYQISLHVIVSLWFCLWAFGCSLGHLLQMVNGQVSSDLGAMDLPHRPAVGRQGQSKTVLRSTQGGPGWWGEGSRS